MNILIASVLVVNTAYLAASTLDGTTVVPIGPVLGSAATVLLVGMWISKKVTRFEEMCVRFAEQQGVNMARLDRFDAHLCQLEERQASFSEKLVAFHERLAYMERNKQ